MTEIRSGLALFPNSNKKADNHPDFRGELTVSREELKEWVKALEGDHVKLRVACWAKTSKNGKRFLSGSVKVDTGVPPEKAKAPDYEAATRQQRQTRNYDDSNL